MRNIRERYEHVYIFLIRKQKQNLLANVRLSVSKKKSIPPKFHEYRTNTYEAKAE